MGSFVAQVRHALLMGFPTGRHLLGREIPNLDGVVSFTAGRDQLFIIAGQDDRRHPDFMHRERVDFGIGVEVPDFNRLILTAGIESFAVAGKCKAMDGGCVAKQGFNLAETARSQIRIVLSSPAE